VTVEGDPTGVTEAVPIERCYRETLSWTRHDVGVKGGVVVAGPDQLIDGAETIVRHEHPRWLFGRMVERLHPRRTLRLEIVDDVEIATGAVIGGDGFAFDMWDGRWYRFPHIGGVRIGSGTTIGANTCIDRGSLGDTVIGADCQIDNLVHVAHNVLMGRGVMVVAGTVIGGSAAIGDYAWLGMGCRIAEGVTVGAFAFIGAGAVVTKDVEPMAAIVGVNRRIELDPTVRPRLGY